jgi:hypothetical protein
MPGSPDWSSNRRHEVAPLVLCAHQADGRGGIEFPTPIEDSGHATMDSLTDHIQSTWLKAAGTQMLCVRD